MLQHSSGRLEHKPQQKPGAGQGTVTQPSRQPGKSKRIDLSYQAKASESIFSLDTEPSPVQPDPCPSRSSTALRSSFPSAWSHSQIVFPSVPERLLSVSGQGEAGIFGGFQGIRKEFASGNLFPPSAWDKLCDGDGGFAARWGTAQI